MQPKAGQQPARHDRSEPSCPRATRATRPLLPLWQMQDLHWAAQGRATSGALRLQRAERRSCDATNATHHCGQRICACGSRLGRDLRVEVAVSLAHPGAARATRPPLPASDGGRSLQCCPRLGCTRRYKIAASRAHPRAACASRPQAVRLCPPRRAMDRRCVAQLCESPSASRLQQAEQPNVFPCDATAAATTAGGRSAPGGPSVGSTRRVTVTASQARLRATRA